MTTYSGETLKLWWREYNRSRSRRRIRELTAGTLRCFACGEKFDIKRLRVVGESVFCVHCIRKNDITTPYREVINRARAEGNGGARIPPASGGLDRTIPENSELDALMSRIRGIKILLGKLRSSVEEIEALVKRGRLPDPMEDEVSEVDAADEEESATWSEGQGDEQVLQTSDPWRPGTDSQGRVFGIMGLPWNVPSVEDMEGE